jgi:hypothetical protein
MFEAQKSRSPFWRPLRGLLLIPSCALAVGCTSSWPAPNDRMAQAEASVRGAEEVGARSEPQAALHLKLAQEQIAAGKSLMADGENKRAEYVFLRAGAEAELALSMAKAKAARIEAQKAIEEVNKLRSANATN